MDPIDRLSRLIETLRQRMAESAKRPQASAQTTQPNQARSLPPSSRRLTVQELRQRITQRTRAIEPGSPEREQQARRIFFESVLAWEFGDQLLLDSQFNRLLDGIQDAFESDPETHRELNALLTELSTPP
ncbi:MAG TPA: hypothetical protein VJ733_06205 [Candidatus Binatia bacterium]|nr:hypothetical protein [Candidatus Binatia bacterium]